MKRDFEWYLEIGMYTMAALTFVAGVFEILIKRFG